LRAVFSLDARPRLVGSELLELLDLGIAQFCKGQIE
jgi:hypothetical protein